MDILARLGERFTFDDIESEVVMVEGVRVFVATPRMLYRMKKDTVPAAGSDRRRSAASTIRHRRGRVAMGVKKYRSVAEMPSKAWAERLNPDNLRQACALMAWTRLLSPPKRAPGVRKYRSVGEASRRSEVQPRVRHHGGNR